MRTREAPPAQKDGFRPDLEGLRAIAVVLVLLYHASVPGVTGGYVGVDVFFVLSGFLITGLLMRELDATGTISLAAFYARRARRLLPAVAVLILVTVIASTVVLSPLRAGEVAKDGIAAALYTSNLRFAFQATDYLQSELPPSPLLHLWSLGVEEQFYLFWPALLLIATRGVGHLGALRLRRIGILAVVVATASLALSLWLTTASEPWAFFSLPTRAWELGIGAILAVGAARLARLPSAAATGAGWVGLAMIAISGLVIDTNTPFPGLAALLPTVGCALAMLPGMVSQASMPARLLGWGPARFMGRISYSLYLWHWPLLVLPLAVAGGTLPLAVRVGLMIAAIPIAYASQHWLEDPIRHGRFVGIVPRRNLALAGAVSAGGRDHVPGPRLRHDPAPGGGHRGRRRQCRHVRRDHRGRPDPDPRAGHAVPVARRSRRHQMGPSRPDSRPRSRPPVTTNPARIAMVAISTRPRRPFPTVSTAIHPEPPRSCSSATRTRPSGSRRSSGWRSSGGGGSCR